MSTSSPNSFNYDTLAIFFGMLKYYDDSIRYHGKDSDMSFVRRSSTYDYMAEYELAWEYSKTITSEKIVEFIEYLFSPDKFISLNYDKNFFKNVDKFRPKEKGALQIWCEGPVLLKKIEW